MHAALIVALASAVVGADPVDKSGALPSLPAYSRTCRRSPLNLAEGPFRAPFSSWRSNGFGFQRERARSLQYSI